MGSRHMMLKRHRINRFYLKKKNWLKDLFYGCFVCMFLHFHIKRVSQHNFQDLGLSLNFLTCRWIQISIFMSSQEPIYGFLFVFLLMLLS